MDKLPTIEGLSQMDAATTLLADLQDFNKKYSTYVRCTDTMVNPKNSILHCSAYDMSLNTVNVAYSKLTDLSGDFALLKKSKSDAISKDKYDASYNYIINTYDNEIIPTRMDLDRKMNQLNDMMNSKTDNAIQFDNTMYLYLLWTTVATCTVYFVFTKL